MKNPNPSPTEKKPPVLQNSDGKPVTRLSVETTVPDKSTVSGLSTVNNQNSEVQIKSTNDLSGKESQGTGNHNIAASLSNAAGLASRTGKTIVNSTINTGGSGVQNTLKLADGIIDALPNTNQNGETLVAIQKALDSGATNVKALTGAKTVSEGKEILKNIQVVGKIGKWAGVAGTVLTPFTELDTSANMFTDEDLELIRQYNSEGYNEACAWAVIGTTADAASWGIVRSVAKTPSALVRLVPGDDPSWTDTYDNNINSTFNAANIYEQASKIFK